MTLPFTPHCSHSMLEKWMGSVSNFYINGYEIE